LIEEQVLGPFDDENKRHSALHVTANGAESFNDFNPGQLNENDKSQFVIDGIRHVGQTRPSTTLHLWCSRPPVVQEARRPSESLLWQVGKVQSFKCEKVSTAGEHSGDQCSIAQVGLERRFCNGICQCQCHSRSVWYLPLARGYLGSIFVSQMGTLLRFRACDRTNCRSRSTPRISMLYLGPRWLSIASLYLTISNPGRPNISLSFPRIMPPNTEFFICIRSGQRERVKELLTLGEANLADIAAPYDLSVLQLAIVHGQIEIAQFLIAAGASQNPVHYSWTPGDMWDYFAHCSLIQSNMATGAVVDYMQLLAPKNGTNLFLYSAEEIKLKAIHFSRLYKSIFRLSCKKLESIIIYYGNLINEADSCGRTALY
jgi:hypothetical protein